MRPRKILAVGLVFGSLLSWAGQPTSASVRQPSSKPLRFITTGLSCQQGVCALGSGNVGANYGQDIAITGGSCGRPCVMLPVFTVVTGALPPGLRMPRTYGCCGDAIGGTPTKDGAYTFTVRVQDGAGNVARQGFSIEVEPAPRLVINLPASCCPAGTIGTAYLQNFFLSGGVGPYSSSISAGQLPPGLHLSPSPPISISGTPSSAGTFTFTVQVTDSTGMKASEQGSITVS